MTASAFKVSGKKDGNCKTEDEFWMKAILMEDVFEMAF
jgi:hypothetical protein